METLNLKNQQEQNNFSAYSQPVNIINNNDVDDIDTPDDYPNIDIDRDDITKDVDDLNLKSDDDLDMNNNDLDDEQDKDSSANDADGNGSYPRGTNPAATIS